MGGFDKEPSDSSQKAFLYTNNLYNLIKSNSYFKAALELLATESPLKVMKNAFYFTFRALFVLKIFKFLS